MGYDCCGTVLTSLMMNDEEEIACYSNFYSARRILDEKLTRHGCLGGLGCTASAIDASCLEYVEHVY